MANPKGAGAKKGAPRAPRGSKGRTEVETKTGEVIPKAQAGWGTTDRITAQEMEVLGMKHLHSTTNAAYLGIAPATYFKLLNERPDLRLALRRGRAKVMAKLSNQVLVEALKGNVYAAVKMLSLEGGWRDPTLGYHNDNDGEPKDIGPHEADEPENRTSGVLLLPPNIKSHEEWEKKAREHYSSTKDSGVAEGKGGADNPPQTPEEGGVGSTGG